MTPNLDRLYTRNNLDELIPDLSALASASDSEYFAVLSEATTRVRLRLAGDPAPALRAPSGMRPCVIVGRDGGVIAMYFADERIPFRSGVDVSEVLLQTPNFWSRVTQHHVGGIGGCKASIPVPFVP